MAIEKARTYLRQWDMDDKILEFTTSSATVELAALALNCQPERIAKTLSFKMNESCILIVCAGDAKVDNAKFKGRFETKAKMLSPQEVVDLVGHEVGGVCPFGINEGVGVYLDVSLKRFDTVFPACGSGNSAIELTVQELEKTSMCREWVDICKAWKI